MPDGTVTRVPLPMDDLPADVFERMGRRQELLQEYLQALEPKAITEDATIFLIIKSKVE